MTTRRELEEKWEKLRRVPVAPSKKLPVLFDRRRRIDLLWQLFFAALFLLLLFSLIAGVR